MSVYKDQSDVQQFKIKSHENKTLAQISTQLSLQK